jgi:uncharacterized protein YlxP (DUF503 family)
MATKNHREIRTFVGVLRSELFFPGLRTLKERRGPLRSLLDRLRGMGMSAAQVGPAGFVRQAWISAGCTSGTSAGVSRMLDRAAVLFESPEWELVSMDRDIFEASAEMTLGNS